MRYRIVCKNCKGFIAEIKTTSSKNMDFIRKQIKCKCALCEDICKNE